jgi:ParB family chromosome partitioning protein
LCELTVAKTNVGHGVKTADYADLVPSIRQRGILTELGGATVADGNKGETAKVQKGIIRDFLTGSNGRAKFENWLPAYDRFPAASYTERGGTGCGERWARVAALFENPSA